MAVKRKPGTTIRGFVYFKKPGGTEVYDLTEAQNYLMYFYVISGATGSTSSNSRGRLMIKKYSREAIDGYVQVNEDKGIPAEGKVWFVIEGQRTKNLRDISIQVDPVIQFDDEGEPYHVGAEEGVNYEVVIISDAAEGNLPTA